MFSIHKPHLSEVALLLGVIAAFVVLIGVGIGLGVLTSEMIVAVCLLAFIGIGAAALSLICS